MCSPNSNILIMYLKWPQRPSKSCEFAENDMRYVLILSTAAVRICKYRQRNRGPSLILCKKFTLADLYMNILALVTPLASPALVAQFGFIYIKNIVTQ